MRRRVLWVLLCAASLAATALAPLTLATPAWASVLQYGKVVFVDDGDTVDVDVYGDGTSKPVRVRFIGIQAMELHVYSSDLQKIRGECTGVAATKRMHALVYGKKVRLTARYSGTRNRGRPMRSVAVKIGGVWRDVGQIMVTEGLVLWDPRRDEYTHNLDYAIRAQKAAAARRGIWDSDRCGSGPYQSTPLHLTVNWDADGDDQVNPNGEYFAVRNDGSTSVNLAGWWLRDSALRRFTFPSGTHVPAGATVYLHPGDGTNTSRHFYWHQDGPVFENVTGSPTYMGDGGYLFDPQGDLRAWQQYPCRYGC